MSFILCHSYREVSLVEFSLQHVVYEGCSSSILHMDEMEDILYNELRKGMMGGVLPVSLNCFYFNMAGKSKLYVQ